MEITHHPVIVKTGLARALDLGRVVPTGLGDKHAMFEPLHLPHLAAGLVPVGAGEIEIHQHQVGPERPGERERRFGAVIRDLAVMAEHFDHPSRTSW